MIPGHQSRAVTELTRRGAYLVLRGRDVEFPAGLVVESAPGHWFAWAACGESEFDSTIFDADRMIAGESGGIVFFHAGEEVARLIPLPVLFEAGPRRDWAASAIVSFWREYDRGGRLKKFVDSLSAHRA